ncbi:MAG: hypothetical protein PF440_02495 [Thiomicrorhabdus sp.]|jgi:hypothetical protein|nr:hypothetical protein [Thiomicrorhabdus sp.]
MRKFRNNFTEAGRRFVRQEHEPVEIMPKLSLSVSQVDTFDLRMRDIVLTKVVIACEHPDNVPPDIVAEYAEEWFYGDIIEKLIDIKMKFSINGKLDEAKEINDLLKFITE